MGFCGIVTALVEEILAVGSDNVGLFVALGDYESVTFSFNFLVRNEILKNGTVSKAPWAGYCGLRFRG